MGRPDLPRERRRPTQIHRNPSPKAGLFLLTIRLLTLLALVCAALLGAEGLPSTARAQSADPKPLITQALVAVGGKEKLLKIYRLKEIFHFGETPEPAAGKKRNTRDSILSQPDHWWINKKERGPDPAKDDARAWLQTLQKS